MQISKFSVMIVDDSSTARRILTDIINRHPKLAVSAVAADPYEAVESLKTISPDVMVLDVQMPRMDGVTFLEKLMRIKSLPVVMCSSFTKEGSRVSLECLEKGAVDIIAKPKAATPTQMRDLETRIHDTLLSAVLTRRRARERMASPNLAKDTLEKRLHNSADEKLSADAVLTPPNLEVIKGIPTTSKVVAIGASTGGVDAIRAILKAMPPDCPGIVIAQHMPEQFTETFAQRLNEQCQIEVRDAKNGGRVENGLALVSPGSHHMVLKRSGQNYFVDMVEGPLVNRHRPSVDVLFRSVAVAAGPNAIGVILTGMGDDGATGMREMKEAGSGTVAQDEATSVVFGMPNEAIKQGGWIGIVRGWAALWRFGSLGGRLAYAAIVAQRREIRLYNQHASLFG